MHQPPATRLGPGLSTAGGGLVEYRIDRLAALGLLHGRWLDCGTNDGAYAAYLRRTGACEVVGTDIDPSFVEQWTERWGNIEGLSFAVASAEELPFEDSTFDGVFLNEVLEHVADERLTLRELHRVLRGGGVLAVYSPNRWFPFEQHGALIGGKRLNFPIPLLPWLPSRLTRHVMKARNWWPGELKGLVAYAGFTIVKTGFAFPLLHKHNWLPLYVLEPYLRNLGRIHGAPVVSRFGISTLIIARKGVIATSVDQQGSRGVARTS